MSELGEHLEKKETELGVRLYFSGMSQSCINADDIEKKGREMWQPEYGPWSRTVFVEDDLVPKGGVKRYGEFVGLVQHEQGGWRFHDKSHLEGVKSTRLALLAQRNISRGGIMAVMAAIEEAAKDLPAPRNQAA